MAPPPSSVSAHHVIVDSGGFIANAPIKDLAPNVYCIQEVVNEIKDKATKQRLQANVANCRSRFVFVFIIYECEIGQKGRFELGLKFWPCTDPLSLLFNRPSLFSRLAL